jgi:hypothetical protein
VLSKFLKMYEEMAREIESEPWASVHAWAEEPTRSDWQINSGINFMQFVDCLGVSAPSPSLFLRQALSFSSDEESFSRALLAILRFYFVP